MNIEDYLNFEPIYLEPNSLVDFYWGDLGIPLAVEEYWYGKYEPIEDEI